MRQKERRYTTIMSSNKNAEVYIDKVKSFFLFKGVSPTLVKSTLEDERCTIEKYSEGTIIFSPEHFRKMLCLVLRNRKNSTLKPMVNRGKVYCKATPMPVGIYR